MKLKTKLSPIPNGFDFRFPQLSNWRPAETSRWSWTLLVSEVLTVILANPTYAHNYSWPSSRAAVEDWIEQFNCKLCLTNRWWDYLEGGQAQASPFPQGASLMLHGPNARAAVGASSQPSKPPGWFKKLGQIATGVKTLADWLGDDGKPVDGALSEARAQVCAGCPQNKQGDWFANFTVPASNLIRRQLEQRREMKLTTTTDANLGVCEACGCPLRLKVHVPLEYIKAHMAPDAAAALDARCWITKE